MKNKFICILTIACLIASIGLAKEKRTIPVITVGQAQDLFNNSESGAVIALNSIVDSIQKKKVLLNTSRTKEQQIMILKSLGEMNYSIGHNEIAIGFLQTCIKQMETEYTQSNLLAEVHISLGRVYQQAGNIDKALDCYYHALNTILKNQSLENERLRAKVYCKMSTAFYVLKQFNKAKEYAAKTDSLLQIIPDASIKGDRLLSQGVTLSENSGSSVSTGLAYFKSALQLGIDHKNSGLIFIALVNMGVSYYKMDSTDHALACLKKAIAVKDFYNQFYFNAALSTIGEIYFTKGDYINAETYLLQALKGGLKVGHKEIQLYANEFLYKLYKASGNNAKAIVYLEGYYNLKIEIEGKEINKNANELEIKYKSAEKDNEIVNKNLLLLKQQSELKSNTLILGSIVVLFLFVLLGFRLFSIKQSSKILVLKKEQEINNLKAIIQGEEQERSRIAGELHDGIGAKVAAVKLNIGIVQNAYPQVENLHQIMKSLDETSREIRETAHNLLPNVILQNTLREALIQYCNGLSNNSELDVTLQYEEEIIDFSNDVKLIFYRIFQELLQNIVKHAHASKAFIQVRERDGILRITVEDNGIGFDPKQIKYGLGLNNIKLRVKVLEGSLSIHAAKDQGSTFFMTFIQSDLIENRQIA